MVLAAVLKGYELATEPVADNGFPATRPVLAAVVEFEFLFGAWMIVAFTPRFNRAVGASCFMILGGVSLAKAVSGESTCGCLGPLQISPWYTFAFDMAATVALYVATPPHGSAGEDADEEAATVALHVATPPHAPSPAIVSTRWGGLSWRGITIACALLVLAGAGGWFMGTYKPAELTDEGRIAGRGRVVVADPAKWLGKRLPLGDFGVGDEFYRGSWVLLFVRSGCARCDPALARVASVAFSTSQMQVGVIGVDGKMESNKNVAAGCDRQSDERIPVVYSNSASCAHVRWCCAGCSARLRRS